MDVWSLGVCLFELAAGTHGCMHACREILCCVCAVTAAKCPEPLFLRHPPPADESYSTGQMQWGCRPVLWLLWEVGATGRVSALCCVQITGVASAGVAATSLHTCPACKLSWLRVITPNLLCCCVSGYKPFQGVSYEGIAAAVIQHAMADLPPHLSPAFKSFMAAALTYDPQQRPSAQQLLDHPWVQVRICCEKSVRCKQWMTCRVV